MKKVLILPGTSNPVSPNYREVYDDIVDIADRHGFASTIVAYPGHGRGLLTFKGAVHNARSLLREYRATWIIARSFGCAVAAEVLADERLAENIEGAVFWGPTLSNWVRRFLPTELARRRETAKYRKYDANLADDFLDDFPMLEVNIERAFCNIRLVRGVKDKYNSREDLDFLAAVHRRGQPRKICSVLELSGLGHTIVPTTRTSQQLTNYSDALFGAFMTTA